MLTCSLADSQTCSRAHVLTPRHAHVLTLTLAHSPAHSALSRLLTHSLAKSFTQSFTGSLTHASPHSLNSSPLTHSLARSLTSPRRGIMKACVSVPTCMCVPCQKMKSCENNCAHSQAGGSREINEVIFSLSFLVPVQTEFCSARNEREQNQDLRTARGDRGRVGDGQQEDARGEQIGQGQNQEVREGDLKKPG